MKNKTVSRMMAIALSLAVAFSQPMLVNAENNPTPEQIEAAKTDVVNQANSISNSSENIGEDIEAIDKAFNPSFDEDIDGKINEAYKGNTTENVTGLNDASANVSTNLTGTNGAVAELNNATAAKSELEQIEKTVSGAIESANSAIGTANTSATNVNTNMEKYLNDITNATTAEEANRIYQNALDEYEAANRDYEVAKKDVAAAEEALNDAKTEIASQEKELGRASDSSKQKLEEASINLEAAKKAAETLQKEAQNAMDKAEQALNGAQVALDNMGPLVDGALAIIAADKEYKNKNGNGDNKRTAGANVLLEMAKYYYSVKKPDALSLKESDKVTYDTKLNGTTVTVNVCVNGVIKKTLKGEIQKGNNQVDNRTTDEFYLTIDGEKYTETTFRNNIGFDPNEAQNYETKKKEAEANLAAAKAAKESVDAKYGALKSDSAFKSEPTADKSYIEKAMEDVETLKSAVPTAPNSSLNDTLPSMLNTSTFDAITNLMNTLKSTLGEIEKKKDDLNKPDPDPNGGNGGNGNGNGGNGNGNGGNGNGNGGNGNGGNGGNGTGGNGGNGTGGNSGNNDDGTGNGGNNAGGNGITPLGNPAPANNGAAVMNAVANTGRNNNVVADAPAQEIEEAVADTEEEIVAADAEDIVDAEQVDETSQEGLTTQIDDNKTPLADAAPLSEEEKAAMPWIWALIVAALGAVGIALYRQFAKKAKQVK